jgi:hypothetical protein
MDSTIDIDNEWEKFCKEDDISSDEEDDNYDITEYTTPIYEEYASADISIELANEIPKATDIYISTKTKIAYLNRHINLKDLFWKINIIPYATPANGVVKKQMKFNSLLVEELTFIKEKLKFESYFEEHIITHIDNPSGRIKFKDTRKVSIGISKKDILSYRSKKKSAFYNCFVIILRIKVNSIFREFHVKVFNTGKLEIPGVKCEKVFGSLMQQVIDTLQPYVEDILEYKENSNETVLINSNFNCGFYINREILYDILKYKYNIQAIFDPCLPYPGIQCKFYYNPDISIQTGSQISEENKDIYKNIKQVSFMIFRTGSVLIVGKCDEELLMIIYEFLKTILANEYKNICQKVVKVHDERDKNKIKKIRKKNILIDIQNI